MGLSKSMMEKVIISRSRINKANISMVLLDMEMFYFRGSVLPLFIKQAKKKNL